MIGVNGALWHSINSCCRFAKDKQFARQGRVGGVICYFGFKKNKTKQ